MSSSGSGKLIKAEFGTTNLYAILEIEDRQCDARLITQSYRKLALKYHPDRSTGNAAKFQALSAVHAILSNEEQRKVYDETGSIDDADENGDDNPESFAQWNQYFRNLFPEVTTQDIEAYLAEYRQSESEKTDIIELYRRFDGNVIKMFHYIIGSDDDDAEIRICGVIDAAIANQEIESTELYTKNKQKFLQSVTKRLQKRKTDEKKLNSTSSSKKAKAAVKDDLASLQQSILAKQQHRGQKLMSSMNKYLPADVDAQVLEGDMDEDEFVQLRDSLTHEKNKKTAAKSTNQSKTTSSSRAQKKSK